MSKSIEQRKEDMKKLLRKTVENEGLLKVSDKNFSLIVNDINVAKNSYVEAQKVINSNLYTQEVRVEEKKKKLQEEYISKTEQANELGKLLSQVVAAGNAEKEEQLEKEIDSLNADIFRIDKKLQTIDNAGVTVNEELFKASEEKYAILSDALLVGQAGLREMQAIIKEKEDEINQVKKLIFVLELNTSKRSCDTINMNRINFYQKLYGRIDVQGHSAGNDDEAKMRFIEGNIRGIENTEAGRILSERMKQK